MAKAKRKMRAAELGKKIRIGLKRFNIKLMHGVGYVNLSPDVQVYAPEYDGMSCAIGGALAYAAKTKEELKKISTRISRNLCGDKLYLFVAKLLNHNLTGTDMRYLEAGFEGEAFLSTELSSSGFRENPFYKLGAELALEASRPAR